MMYACSMYSYSGKQCGKVGTKQEKRPFPLWKNRFSCCMSTCAVNDLNVCAIRQSPKYSCSKKLARSRTTAWAAARVEAAPARHGAFAREVVVAVVQAVRRGTRCTFARLLA